MDTLRRLWNLQRPAAWLCTNRESQCRLLQVVKIGGLKMMSVMKTLTSSRVTQLAVLTLVMVIFFTLAACSSIDGGSASAPEMDKVSLRLSWRWKAEFAPFALAEDKGFFE